MIAIRLSGTSAALLAIFWTIMCGWLTTTAVLCGLGTVLASAVAGYLVGWDYSRFRDQDIEDELQALIAEESAHE